jgi:non-canonical purine NTP pyrophosphatase (RdgB/HAM1 family)
MPLLMIMGAAFAVIVPFFVFGSPSGHDFEFHMFSWMEVVHQWKHGIFFPRWASFAHWTYGEARFLFYPPASWNLGAFLGMLMPWQMTSGAYVWLALTASGASMFLLARRWLNRADAIFASVLYAANPYHLVIVYWRSALAELLASCLIPLLLLFVMRAEDDGKRVILPLSAIVAAAWLTNAPSAVMVNYSLALLFVTVAILHRKSRILFYGAAAVALGTALAAFYIVPAAYEEKWINLSQVLAPGVRPQDNFLFTNISDADHNHFNLFMSIVAVAEILIVGVCLWFLRHRSALRDLWWSLAIWAGAATFLMCGLSFVFWEFLPELRFVQLPWRWLLCLNVPLALAVPFVLPRWRWRLVLYASMIALLLLLWHRVQQSWWDNAADLAEMQDAIEDGTGYEGTDEYVPAGADPYDLTKNAPQVAVVGRDTAHIRILDWGVERKRFTAEVSRPERLRLRLFNYPAWQVEVNGVPIQAKTQPHTEEILVPVDTGISEIRAKFIQTPDRLAGGFVSLGTACLVVGWIFYDRRRSRLPASSQEELQPSQSVRTFMKKILIATSNPGKLRDFAGAAVAHGVAIEPIPHFGDLEPVVEDGLTFEENACKKAEQYSLAVPGEIVLADDSGLEIDALHGAPGVHSARYAAEEPHRAGANTDDDANNARVLRELDGVAPDQRSGRFVCVIVAARDGQALATFRGVAEGRILDRLHGTGGFGYDPMFYFPQIQKTFAELTPEEKAQYSHRGAAFRKFLEWIDSERQQATG